MKNFLQKWLGLELNNSRLNRLENEIRLLNRLNQDTLTNDVNKLKAVMIAIFPNYDSIYAELNRIEAKKTRRAMEDCIGKEIIDRKMETNIENLNNAIKYNNLGLTKLVEKQIDKRLYDLIDKRFNELVENTFPTTEDHELESSVDYAQLATDISIFLNKIGQNKEFVNKTFNIKK